MHAGKKSSLHDKIPARGEFVVRCDQYSLPNSLLEHVSFVFNTVQIPIHHHQLPKRTSDLELSFNHPTVVPFSTDAIDASSNDATDNSGIEITDPAASTGSSRNIHPYSSSSSSTTTLTAISKPAAAAAAAVTTTATTSVPSARPSVKPSARPSSQPTSQPTSEPTNAAITGTLKSTAPHCFVNNTMTPCRLRQGIIQ